MANLERTRLADRKKSVLVIAFIAIAMLLLFAVYADLRWTSEAPAFDKPKQTADTSAYVRVAGEEFLSRRFWANTRPPMFPLLLKVYDADFLQVAPFQAAFSIFSWGMLALAVAFSLKGYLRPEALRNQPTADRIDPVHRVDK